MRDLYKIHESRYRFLKKLFLPLFCRMYNLKAEAVPDSVKAPFLLVSNHTTDLDPVLISAVTDEHMYFVASEHVLRGGIGAWLLKRLFAPIARLKGSTDAACAMAILRKLRGGANVCLFAEGNRSFNGLTGTVFPATGKMVKAAGCSLATCRFEGGYLTSPRWSLKRRRGEMRVRPVSVLSPAELKQMSAEQINALIARDIYEDAYARQAKQQISYRGRRLAEKLETALFLCPGCGGLGTLHSHGDMLECGCGLRARYDEKGYLHGAPFHTVTQWDAWQSGKLPEYIEKGGSICGDARALLLEIGRVGERPAGAGELSLNADELSIGNVRMPLGGVSDMALVGRNRLMLTFEGRHFEIRAGKAFCGRKYLLFYELLKRKGE